MQAKRAITDTFLRHLKPQEKRYDVTDPGRRGFQVPVFPSGQKSFQFRYHRHGLTRRLTIGPYPAVSLAEAHFAHAEAVKLLQLGRDPAAIRLSARESNTAAGTVGELAEEFVQRFVLRERKHPEQVQQMLDRNVLPHWRRRRAQDITPRDVTVLLDRIVDRGSPVMANRVAAVVSQMFKFGVQRGHLTASPCVALQRPGGREKSRDRILTEEEVLTVWRQLDSAKVIAPTRTALRLLLVTAQRRGELARAQWKDIDFEKALWTIPAEHAKNGKKHRVPLLSMALDLLGELKTQDTGPIWLFPSGRQDGSHVAEQSLSRAVRNNEQHLKLVARRSKQRTTFWDSALHTTRLWSHSRQHDDHAWNTAASCIEGFESSRRRPATRNDYLQGLWTRGLHYSSSKHALPWLRQHCRLLLDTVLRPVSNEQQAFARPNAVGWFTNLAEMNPSCD